MFVPALWIGAVSLLGGGGVSLDCQQVPSVCPRRHVLAHVQYIV